MRLKAKTKNMAENECVYDSIKINLESTKIVDIVSVCVICECVGFVVRTLETCMVESLHLQRQNKRRNKKMKNSGFEDCFKGQHSCKGAGEIN